MPPPSRTTATTAGLAPALSSPRGARGRPSRSARSGGWRRQPRAAPADAEPSTQGPGPTEETAPASQAANSAAPLLEGTLDAQGAETEAREGHATAPTDHAAAPGTRPAQGVAPARAPSASPGAAAAAAGGREGAKYRAHTNPSHTHISPTKP